MTRVLVTGATGFIGRHVVTALRARGHEVVATSRHAADAALAADLLDPADRERVVRAAKAEVLVHLAWTTTPGVYWTSSENAVWADASADLARRFGAAGGRRIVGAGSCAEYDWSHEQVTARSPIVPRTPYGVAKDRAHRAMAAAAAEHGASFAWARVHFLFGPGEDPSRFVPSIALALLRGERAECRAPSLRREWLAVEDVAEAFAALVTAPVDGAVDVAAGERLTNGELAQLVAAAAGHPELLVIGDAPRDRNEPLAIEGDADALRGHWTPAVPLRDRIVAYVRALAGASTRGPKPCPHPPAECRVEFSARDYITGDAFTIVHCSRCGFSVTTPVPSPSAMGRYYPAGYYGEAGSRRFPAPIEWLQRTLYGYRVRRTERLAGERPGRVLDIGCGRGHLLDAFRHRGWTVEGIELSDAAGAHARDVLGIPVRTGNVEAMDLGESVYDAVVLWHVLEHFPNPRGVLAQAARALKPGGVLLVAVPNFGSLQARIARNAWFHLDVPRHLTHFTPESLGRALEGVGMRGRSRSGFAPEFDAFGFTQSVENMLGLPQNLLYNVLRGQSAKVIGRDAARLELAGVALLLAAPLGVISLPLTTLAALAGSGGTMTVWATR